ncbi:MAG: hypothetical protein L0210_03045 [Rhodospirillales bacterium]|nr:hypothetical protein [Rhodospirillales bacterium]
MNRGRLLQGLILTAVFRRSAGEAKALLRRATRRAALFLLSVFLTACGGGFLVAAGFAALANEIGTIEASLSIGIAFVIAGATLLAAIGLRKRSLAPTKPASHVTPLTEPLREAGQEFSAAVSRNPATFVVAAFVAGMLLSRHRTGL